MFFAIVCFFFLCFYLFAKIHFCIKNTFFLLRMCLIILNTVYTLILRLMALRAIAQRAHGGCAFCFAKCTATINKKRVHLHFASQKVLSTVQKCIWCKKGYTNLLQYHLWFAFSPPRVATDPNGDTENAANWNCNLL